MRTVCGTALFVLIGVGAGCKGRLDLGSGMAQDARLIADIYTWPCLSGEEGPEVQGVFSFDISLEYAPDGLQSIALPDPGTCSASISMFPVDAGAGGADIPGVERDPGWTNGTEQGTLQQLGPGFYFDSALDNQHTCQAPEDMFGDGVSVERASVFTGASTPAAGIIGEVLTTDADGDGLLSFGEVATVEFANGDWDETWVQVRQERDGEAWGYVTCNTTGSTEFAIDESVWAHLDGTLPVETINLYVGFTNTEEQEMDDGQKIKGITRGIHVLVVQD